MIKHIVMYKLADYSEENAKILMDKFMSMKGKIPQLVDIQSGCDIMRAERSFDVALVCVFNNLEDMKKYTISEVHLPVMAYVKSVVSLSKSVDFEY